MGLFWLEYLHFIVAIFAILVSVSATALFFLTYRTEAKLTTAWRAIGFASLALGFFLLILERKFPGVGIFALAVEAFGFYGILRGVSADLNLSKLQNIAPTASSKKTSKKKKSKKEEPKKGIGSFITNLLVLVIIGIIAILLLVLYEDFVLSAEVAFMLIFILATIRLQIRRYRRESSSKKTRRQNLYPLVAYIFLGLAGVSFLFYRLPELDIVLFREIQLNYSLAWQLGLWLSLIGFFFLAVWAWAYIRVRVTLRTYVVFMTIGVVISSLGALVFTQLIFSIVERNNLELMERGARSEQTILLDRLDTALFVAHTIALTPGIADKINVGDRNGITVTAEQQLFDASLDILRIYNADGEVISSPGDIRDVGRVFNEDDILNFVITQRSQLKTFDVEEGILTPQMIARGLYPIVSAGEVVGVVEASYRIDDGFVDFSKDSTGLDVTIYVGTERSATTVTTLDGVSRWVGSKETDQEVKNRVLGDSQIYSTPAERLGVPYYSGYIPVKDVNDQVIGMVSVGSPTVILFEDTRQQLVTTFLIVTIISFFSAWLGQIAIKNFREQDLLRRKAK